MLYRLAMWIIKRRLRMSGSLVLERKVEHDLINLMLDQIEEEYTEDNMPTHIYLMTFFLAKTIRERYTTWDTEFLTKYISKGMVSEVTQTLSNPNYQYVNDDMNGQDIYKHLYNHG